MTTDAGGPTGWTRGLARVPGPLPVVGVLSGGVACLALLRRQPLSWDEAVSVAVATRPVHAIATTLHHSDAVLGVYYLMLHAWASLASAVGLRPTEWWWRLPSAVAAVATCVVAAAYARRVAGPRAALLAGALLAVLPLFAFYAVDARPYTFAALAATAAWFVWTGGTRARVAVPATVILLVAGAWLQLFTVLVWPAFLLVAGRAGRGRAIVALTVAAVAVAPLGWVALHQSGEIGWIPPASLGNTLSVAVHLGGGVGVVAFVILLSALAFRARLVRRGPVAYAVAWWVGAPFAVLATLDLVRPVLVARYALVSLPLLAVGVGVVTTRAVRGREHRLVRVIGGATLVAACVTTVLQTARPWKYEDYRTASAFASATAPGGASVLYVPSTTRLGFLRYPLAPAVHDLALPGGVGADPLALPEVTPPLLPELISAQCTVLVVGKPLDAPPTSAADRTKLHAVASWNLRAVRHFGDVTVSELTNPSCPGTPPPGG